MNFHVTPKQLLATGIFVGTVLLPLVVVGQDLAKTSKLAQQRLATRDSDNDGLPDSVERQIGTNPKLRDSNKNGIWDGDEVSSTLGITFGEAYKRGYYNRAAAEDGSDFENDADGDDGASSGGAGAVTQPRPRPLPKITCTRPHQRNCRLPVCKSNARKNSKLCRPPVKGVNPTPRPRVTPGGAPAPTVRPTAVPPVQSGNFDASGNTNKFGIPSGMSGNINAGSGVQSSSCNGCHGEMQGASFGVLKGALTRSPMTGIHLSDKQLADLTAYLNRFNK